MITLVIYWYGFNEKNNIIKIGGGQCCILKFSFINECVLFLNQSN